MKRIIEPLRFERVFLEKIWGGRSLSKSPAEGGLWLSLPAGVPIGETWELVDREDVNSVVAEGPWQGSTLHDLMRENPTDLLGDLPATPPERVVALTFLRLAPCSEPRGDETRHELRREMTSTVS